MTKFFLAAGAFLEILLLLSLKISTRLFVLILKPSPQPELANLAIVWFWLLGFILTAVVGTITVSLAANWYKQKHKIKDSTLKMVLLSWFSFFAFLAITTVGFVALTLIKAYRSFSPPPPQVW